jgi:multicomponent Na+:H+ antiporter subunit G
MRTVIADALLVLGLVIVSIGVYGVVRLPDVYSQLHAASKVAFIGVSALLAAAAVEGDAATIARAVLIVALLAVTTPVSSHAIARAAFRREVFEPDDHRGRDET